MKMNIEKLEQKVEELNMIIKSKEEIIKHLVKDVNDMQIIVNKINFEDEDEANDEDVPLEERNELYDKTTADLKAIDFMATSIKHIDNTEKEIRKARNILESNWRLCMIKWKMNLIVSI